MADDSRPSSHDLITPPEAMSFFELLRRLERPGKRFGRSGGPRHEPARLGQAARLTVATRDVARVVPSPVGHPPRIEVEVLGLLGPEGPMPLHLTRWVFERVSQRWFEAESEHATSDTAALDFCNLLQHRLLALYWRAWGDSRLQVHLDRPGAGRIGAVLAALAGVGLPGQRRAPAARATESTILDHARRIGHEVRGPERLTAPVADFLGAPVRVVEFIGSWVEIPPHLRSRLGRAHVRLGAGAVVGARVFSRTDRAELRVGPVGLRPYLALADDPGLRERLKHLLLHLMGHEIDLDLRPVVAREEVPAPRLGGIALGRTAWLPTRWPSDRDDFRLSRMTRIAA